VRVSVQGSRWLRTGSWQFLYLGIFLYLFRALEYILVVSPNTSDRRLMEISSKKQGSHRLNNFPLVIHFNSAESSSSFKSSRQILPPKRVPNLLTPPHLTTTHMPLLPELTTTSTF
jgi:hypothetical protein